MMIYTRGGITRGSRLCDIQRLWKVGNFFDEIQKILRFVMGFESNLINLLAPDM